MADMFKQALIKCGRRLHHENGYVKFFYENSFHRTRESQMFCEKRVGAWSRLSSSISRRQVNTTYASTRQTSGPVDHVVELWPLVPFNSQALWMALTFVFTQINLVVFAGRILCPELLATCLQRFRGCLPLKLFRYNAKLRRENRSKVCIQTQICCDDWPRNSR